MMKSTTLLFTAGLLAWMVPGSMGQVESLSLRGENLHERLDDVMLGMEMESSSPEMIGVKCFESSEELRAAVKRYKSYTVIDMDMASLYGWPLNHWCVSNIEDFSNLFDRKTHFNEPLDGWDMSSATSVSGMFASAYQFNQSLASWDVSKVTDFSRMFLAATHFNGNIQTWNTSQAVDMSYMFMHAHAFHQDVFRYWDVARVEHMEETFFDARAMVDSSFDSSVWPLLNGQEGVPTIKLTNREKGEPCRLRACDQATK
jgi:Mycoplasma protein of unknown function, DUF285